MSTIDSRIRMIHSYRVAEKMKNIVLSCKDIDFNISPEDAFVLGFMHDIGYQLLDDHNHDASKHNILGGQFLEDKFRYWKEVYYHGEVQNEYDSNALFLLNYCDMTTDMRGQDVSMDMRIQDIIKRYGDNSKAYEKACAMKKFLESDERFKKLE